MCAAFSVLRAHGCPFQESKLVGEGGFTQPSTLGPMADLPDFTLSPTNPANSEPLEQDASGGSGNGEKPTDHPQLVADSGQLAPASGGAVVHQAASEGTCVPDASPALPTPASGDGASLPQRSNDAVPASGGTVEPPAAVQTTCLPDVAVPLQPNASNAASAGAAAQPEPPQNLPNGAGDQEQTQADTTVLLTPAPVSGACLPCDDSQSTPATGGAVGSPPSGEGTLLADVASPAAVSLTPAPSEGACLPDDSGQTRPATGGAGGPLPLHEGTCLPDGVSSQPPSRVATAGTAGRIAPAGAPDPAATPGPALVPARGGTEVQRTAEAVKQVLTTLLDKFLRPHEPVALHTCGANETETNTRRRLANILAISGVRPHSEACIDARWPRTEGPVVLPFGGVQAVHH